MESISILLLDALRWHLKGQEWQDAPRSSGFQQQAILLIDWPPLASIKWSEQSSPGSLTLLSAALTGVHWSAETSLPLALGTSEAVSYTSQLFSLLWVTNAKTLVFCWSCINILCLTSIRWQVQQMKWSSCQTPSMPWFLMHKCEIEIFSSVSEVVSLSRAEGIFPRFSFSLLHFTHWDSTADASWWRLLSTFSPVQSRSFFLRAQVALSVSLLSCFLWSAGTWTPGVEGKWKEVVIQHSVHVFFSTEIILMGLTGRLSSWGRVVKSPCRMETVDKLLGGSQHCSLPVEAFSSVKYTCYPHATLVLVQCSICLGRYVQKWLVSQPNHLGLMVWF